jgi:transglutaminase-like putative cysteine protease
VIYGVRHLTTYRYESEVAYARCLLRLTPCTNAGQTLLHSSVTVAPAPVLKTIKRDAFGAQVVSMVIDTPHEALTIESRCAVEVHVGEPPAAAAGPPWETVRRKGLASRRLDVDSPALYLYPTRSTPITPQITGYARESFPAGRPILKAAAELMSRLKSEFAYDPEATDVRTPAEEAFAKRRGVCQDFAHVMICALRGLGLPVRYVSGYIRTLPAPGQRRLEGADATHAWVEVWCGEELGWVGLDPTNNLFTGGEHLTLAYGRDYHDAAPIDGVLLGAGCQRLEVEVDVVELAPAEAEAPATSAQEPAE